MRMTEARTAARGSPLMESVREQEDVAGSQRAGRPGDAPQHRPTRGASGQQALHLELPGARDVCHVAGVGLARVEFSAPALVVPGIDRVQPDRERQSLGHVTSPCRTIAPCGATSAPCTRTPLPENRTRDRIAGLSNREGSILRGKFGAEPEESPGYRPCMTAALNRGGATF